MRRAVVLAGLVALASERAIAAELEPEIHAGAWMVSGDGQAVGTELEPLGFDEVEPELEIGGSLTIGGRHRLGIEYLRLDRRERGVSSTLILGILAIDQRVALDLDADSLRAHYGYSAFQSEWFDLEPFLEIGYIREETRVENLSTGMTGRSDETLVFPLPGLAVVVGPPNLPMRLRASAVGMGFDGNRLIDLEAGLEAQFGPAFGGIGWRHADVRIDDGGDDADVELRGVFFEGGLRWQAN